MRLDECVQGDRVVIKKIYGEGNFKKRLLEMGFMSGIEVEIIKYAPLKDPVELEIKGFRISLRVEESTKIEVGKIED